MLVKPFTFAARLSSIYDGDTMRLDVDRGERLWSMGCKYRLYGVDTPEISRCSDEEKEYGFSSRSFVNSVLVSNQSQGPLTISTHHGQGKYDWLVEIYVSLGPKLEQLDGLMSLHDLIILRGHGVPYTGGTKLSWSERKQIQDEAKLRLPTEP